MSSSPGLVMDLDEAEWRNLYGELLEEQGSGGGVGGGGGGGGEGIEMVETALLSTRDPVAGSKSFKRGDGLLDLKQFKKYLEGEPGKGYCLKTSRDLEVR